MKFNVEALPEGTFDLPILGSNLIKASVEEMTKSWKQADFQRLIDLGYGHFVLKEKDQSTKQVGTPEDKK